MSTASQRSRYKAGQRLTGDNGSYIIIKWIAGGGYGAVYKVKAIDNGQVKATDNGQVKAIDIGQYYALKDEQREPNRDHFKLFMETQVLRKAGNEKEWQRYFPTLYDQCIIGRRSMFIVMSLLGESLGELKRHQPNRVFSKNTGLYCAIEALGAIKSLHEMGYIHRDIKPANFVIGLPRTQNWNRIYMVDFGIARRFVDNNGAILTPRQRTRFKGTVRFAPIATHRQEELGRKDDCESWLYMIVDMIKAERLPWHNLDDRREVENMKKRAMEDPTLLFNDQEIELRRICEYLQKQHYVDNLDYDWMRNMVRRVAKRGNCTLEQPYDWNQGSTNNSGASAKSQK